MGENKNLNDQEVEKINSDQHQIYGSHQKGRHNLEETSPIMSNINNREESSIEQQQFTNQHKDNDNEHVFSDSYRIDDEIYQYSSTSLLNEKAEILSSVEGDDEDILGETENAQRNEQKIRAEENIQSNNHQDRYNN